jgi:hypothetical protein
MKTVNETRELEKLPYADMGYAFYDKKNDQWYNDFGQELRDPEEYNTSSKGYTPFGDK